MLGGFFAPLAIKVLSAVTIAAGLALAVVIWRADAISDQRDRLQEELGDAAALIEILEADIGLREQASLERNDDSAVLADEERELSDARNNQNDDNHTRRLRRLCVKLRQQGGASRGGLSACSRFDDEAGTGNP